MNSWFMIQESSRNNQDSGFKTRQESLKIECLGIPWIPWIPIFWEFQFFENSKFGCYAWQGCYCAFPKTRVTALLPQSSKKLEFPRNSEFPRELGIGNWEFVKLFLTLDSWLLTHVTVTVTHLTSLLVVCASYFHDPGPGVLPAAHCRPHSLLCQWQLQIPCRFLLLYPQWLSRSSTPTPSATSSP